MILAPEAYYSAVSAVPVRKVSERSMDLGTELRQAREQRGLSLRELSERTKINLSILCAIENNDLARLPGGIFTRGFLRAYAREVGLDPAEIVERYTAQSAAAAVASPNGIEQQPITDEDPTVEKESRPYESVRRPAVIAAAALVLLAVASYFAVSGSAPPASDERGTLERQGGPVAVGSTASPSETAAAERGIATAGSSAASATSGASDEVLRFDVQSRALCWISARADGKRIAYRLMRAGDRETIEAHEELILRVGNAGSFDFSINGVSARRLGRAGEVVTVRITSQNYREFLGR
jgi:cytoskeleton protein RodZ